MHLPRRRRLRRNPLRRAGGQQHFQSSGTCGGNEITTAATITGSALPASLVKAISVVSSQRGSSTFAGSNSVAGTLPVALPDTNCSVGISGSAGETFWVTSKSTSGFTLNSSKVNSNATVD